MIRENAQIKNMAYDFMFRMIRVCTSIDGIYRQDIYEFPIGTIRELIYNAVCHRNLWRGILKYVTVALPVLLKI